MFWEYNKKKGLNAKGLKRMGFLFRKQGRLGGFGQNAPPSSTPRRGKTGERLRAPATLGPRPWGMVAAGIRGKRERVGRRFDPRPHLVPGWSVAVRPRWPAAAGGGASGGGAAAEERGRGVAARFVVVGVVLGGDFYSREEAVGGGARQWRPASSV